MFSRIKRIYREFKRKIAHKRYQWKEFSIGDWIEDNISEWTRKIIGFLKYKHIKFAIIGIATYSFSVFLGSNLFDGVLFGLIFGNSGLIIQLVWDQYIKDQKEKETIQGLETAKIRGEINMCYEQCCESIQAMLLVNRLIDKTTFNIHLIDLIKSLNKLLSRGKHEGEKLLRDKLSKIEADDPNASKELLSLLESIKTYAKENSTDIK